MTTTTMPTMSGLWQYLIVFFENSRANNPKFMELKFLSPVKLPLNAQGGKCTSQWHVHNSIYFTFQKKLNHYWDYLVADEKWILESYEVNLYVVIKALEALHDAPPLHLHQAKWPSLISTLPPVMRYIYTKFCEINWNAIEVIEWTWFLYWNYKGNNSAKRYNFHTNHIQNYKGDSS